MLCPPGSLDGEINDEWTSHNGKGSKKEALSCVLFLYCVYCGSAFSCCFIVRYSLKVMVTCEGHAHIPGMNGMCLILSKYCASQHGVTPKLDQLHGVDWNIGAD